MEPEFEIEKATLAAIQEVVGLYERIEKVTAGLNRSNDNTQLIQSQLIGLVHVTKSRFGSQVTPLYKTLYALVHPPEPMEDPTEDIDQLIAEDAAAMEAAQDGEEAGSKS